MTEPESEPLKEPEPEPEPRLTASQAAYGSVLRVISDSGSDGDGEGWATDDGSADEVGNGAVNTGAHVAVAAVEGFRRRPKRADVVARRKKTMRGKVQANHRSGSKLVENDPWQEPTPKYTRRKGFISFVNERIGLAKRRHAHDASRADRVDAAVIIQRFWTLYKFRKGLVSSRREEIRNMRSISPIFESFGGLGQKLQNINRLKPVYHFCSRARSVLMGSTPLEANVGHLHRAILRYTTLLCSLLLTALFIRPSRAHAIVNAVQCSAAATAVHSIMAKAFQRMEQMQNPFYLRRAKKIRSIRKRRAIMDCYSWITWVLDHLSNLLCAFGTYLVLLYWLKFDTMKNQPDLQFYWLYSATLATIFNGVIWGRARRTLGCFQPRRRAGSVVRGTEHAELYFVAMLVCVAIVTIHFVYRNLPPAAGELPSGRSAPWARWARENNVVTTQRTIGRQSPGAV